MSVEHADRQAKARSIITLLFWLAAAGSAALSIHIAMLSSGVPFPVSQPPVWARWLNNASCVVAILVFLDLARPQIDRWGFPSQLLVTFVVLVTVRETFRGAIMAGMVTSAWTFSIISIVPAELVKLFVLALLCMTATNRARSILSLIVAGTVIAGIYVFVLRLANWLFAPIIEHFAMLSHDDVYTFPYPLVVMIPAYLTFAEAVFGATIIAALIWDQLPAGRWTRPVIVALLVASMKGVTIATFLFCFFTTGPVAPGILSYSQFLLEFLVLGFLTGLVWARFGEALAATTFKAVPSTIDRFD